MLSAVVNSGGTYVLRLQDILRGSQPQNQARRERCGKEGEDRRQLQVISSKVVRLFSRLVDRGGGRAVLTASAIKIDFRLVLTR